METTPDQEYLKFVPISDFDQKWGLHIIASGHLRTPPNTDYPQQTGDNPHHWNWNDGQVRPDFNIILIRKGMGIFESKRTGIRRVRQGSIIMAFPGEWIRYRPNRKTGWDECWITFDGEIPRRLLMRGVFSPQLPVLGPCNMELLEPLFDHLTNIVMNQPIGFQQIAASTVYQILTQVSICDRISSSILSESDIDKKIDEARRIMMQNINGNLNMDELAVSLGVGYSWFRRMFKHYTGHSPGQYYLQLKINQAQHLLMKTNLPIKDIADMTGFESPYYFSRMFKNITGESPAAFRSHLHGKHAG